MGVQGTSRPRFFRHHVKRWQLRSLRLAFDKTAPASFSSAPVRDLTTCDRHENTADDASSDVSSRRTTTTHRSRIGFALRWARSHKAPGPSNLQIRGLGVASVRPDVTCTIYMLILKEASRGESTATQSSRLVIGSSATTIAAWPFERLPAKLERRLLMPTPTEIPRLKSASVRSFVRPFGLLSSLEPLTPPATPT